MIASPDEGRALPGDGYLPARHARGLHPQRVRGIARVPVLARSAGKLTDAAGKGVSRAAWASLPLVIEALMIYPVGV